MQRLREYTVDRRVLGILRQLAQQAVGRDARRLVREAGLEAIEGDSGKVLVALTVMTSNRGAAEQQPKSWRTRVTVAGVGDGFKIEAVEFVP